MGKTYGQFCALARALDHVGDRWTLLIVRELLVGDATYGELQSALEGVPTNLLADRLRHLEEDGLVTKERDPEDGRRAHYSLTPLGAGLEPAVMALVRWGSVWMRAGQGEDRFEPRWAVLALRALLSQRQTERAGVAEVRVGHERLSVESRPGEPLRVARAASPDAGAVVEGPPGLVLGLVSGELSMSEAGRRGLRIRGDRALARALLRPPGLASTGRRSGESHYH